MGRPWELLEANEWQLDGLDRRVDGEVHPDADLRGGVVVESGVETDETTIPGERVL